MKRAKPARVRKPARPLFGSGGAWALQSTLRVSHRPSSGHAKATSECAGAGSPGFR